MTMQTTKTSPGERAREDRESLALEAGLIALNAVFEAARAGAEGAGLAAAAGEAKSPRSRLLKPSRK